MARLGAAELRNRPLEEPSPVDGRGGRQRAAPAVTLLARLRKLSDHRQAREVDARRAGLGTLVVFLAPALLIYAGFTLYPVLRTFYNSVHTIKPQGVVEFVGLANFAALLTSRSGVLEGGRQHRASSRSSPRSSTCSAGCSSRSACSRGAPFAQLLRVVWFTPVLMSYVVVGIIWVWIYDYDWGLANAVLRWLGLGAFEQSWLGDPSTALWSVMVTHIWKWLGFNMIVFLAALSCAARRGARRRRARQLRLVRQARLHHHPDAAADDRQSAGAVLHRQDDDLRPRSGS